MVPIAFDSNDGEERHEDRQGEEQHGDRQDRQGEDEDEDVPHFSFSYLSHFSGPIHLLVLFSYWQYSFQVLYNQSNIQFYLPTNNHRVWFHFFFFLI